MTDSREIILAKREGYAEALRAWARWDEVDYPEQSAALRYRLPKVTRLRVRRRTPESIVWYGVIGDSLLSANADTESEARASIECGVSYLHHQVTADLVPLINDLFARPTEEVEE